VKRIYILAGVVVLSIILIGCAPPLRKWVEKRRYTYYEDYSSQNILGYLVRNGGLESNPVFDVKGKKGTIPDTKTGGDSQLTIYGSTEARNFINKTGKGSIKGNLESIKKVEINLKQPFNELIQTIIPKAPCDDRNMVIVSDVLNTGIVHVNIIGNNNLDITAKFNSEIDRIKAGPGIESGNKGKLRGEDLFVGYRTRKVKCLEIAKKEITITRGDQFHDEEIGLFAEYIAFKGEKPEEAVLYITTSRYLPKSWHNSFKLTAGSPLCSECHDNSLQQLSSCDVAAKSCHVNQSHMDVIWKRSLEPSGENSIHLDVKDPASVRLKFGTKVVMSSIPKETGLYMETLELDEDKIRLKAQLIKYDIE
jgi:hypothetical protein